jgi:hypothetical protein
MKGSEGHTSAKMSPTGGPFSLTGLLAEAPRSFCTGSTKGHTCEEKVENKQAKKKPSTKKHQP